MQRACDDLGIAGFHRMQLPFATYHKVDACLFLKVELYMLLLVNSCEYLNYD